MIAVFLSLKYFSVNEFIAERVLECVRTHYQILHKNLRLCVRERTNRLCQLCVSFFSYQLDQELSFSQIFSLFVSEI